MNPLLAYLAAERDAHLRAQGHSDADVREITAREIRTAIRDARRGRVGAREWIDSPAWDIACHLLGRGEVADRYRRVVLADLAAPRVDAMAVLRRGADLLAMWRAHGESERAVAREIGVAQMTAHKWIERALEVERMQEAA